MTYSVTCKKYLRSLARKLMANGTFEAHIFEHIKVHGESPTNNYFVRLHGDGAVITVGPA